MNKGVFIYISNANLHCPNDYVDINIQKQQTSTRICSTSPQGFIILPSTENYNITLRFECDKQSPYSGFAFYLFLAKSRVNNSTTTTSTTLSIKPTLTTTTVITTTTTASIGISFYHYIQNWKLYFRVFLCLP